MNLKINEYPLIQEYKNVFDEEFCQLLIDLFESKKEHHRKGAIGGGVDLSVKNSIDFNLKDHIDPMCLSLIKSKLQLCLNDYSEKNEGLEEVMVDFFLSELVYKKYIKREGFFEGHSDFTNLCPISSNRIVSFCIYLNDVIDGGETSFTTLAIKCKPEVGKVLVFPPFWTHRHKGEIPISNDKYVISCWAVFTPLDDFVHIEEKK